MTAVAGTALLTVLVIGLIVAALIYPGELSQLSPRLNRRLYDGAARTYDDKWRSFRYRDPAVNRSMTDFARESLSRSGVMEVVDLGCGTGRGIRLLLDQLPESTRFTGIDYSSGMIDVFRSWLARQPPSASDRVVLRRQDLADWADGGAAERRYGLVLMLEVGEFVPRFADVMARIADVLAPQGGLIMTRPAGAWWLFFPTRRQSRRSLTALLRSLGFEEPHYRAWRARYELVYAVKR